MPNSSQMRFIFASSHTRAGFHTFIPKLLEGLKKVYILKGATGTGKSTFIKMIGETFYEKGYDIEYWMSALDSISADGVYIPQLEVALVNGNLQHPIEPKYPGVKEEVIYLGNYWDENIIKSQKDEIEKKIDEIEKLYEKVYLEIKKAAQLKADINKAGAAYLNMQKMEDLSRHLCQEIFNHNPQEKHYFASALTAEGIVNYVNESSSNIKKRYILQGPSGSGKSSIIYDVAQKAKEKGYFLEYYYCGLEVESLVMLIVRNLDLALIDAGNISMLNKVGDRIINMEKYLDDFDSEQLKIQCSETYRKYQVHLRNAQEELEKVLQHNNELKKIYSSAMDFTALDKKRNEVIDKIQIY